MTKLPPLRELVNLFEVEMAARNMLAPALFAEVASNTVANSTAANSAAANSTAANSTPASGALANSTAANSTLTSRSVASGRDRRAFDRITFRPRLMQDVTALDLSIELFGQKHFTPILIGPIAHPERFHPGGQAALRKGAEAAQAALVSTVSMAIGAPAGSGRVNWLALPPGADPPANAQVIVLSAVNIAAIGRLRAQTNAAIVVKGVLNAQGATAAIARGAQGLIVSSYGLGEAVHPLEALPAIAQAVHGRVPILVDSGFRRGTDVAKALALGATAVLIARPAIWGLAAYGADGVQYVLEMLQAELARAMAMLGKSTIAQLDPTAVRIHRW